MTRAIVGPQPIEAAIELGVVSVRPLRGLMIVNRLVTLTLEAEVAVVTLDHPPVNAFSAEARAGVLTALQAARAQGDCRAIVLICAGRTFIAGADLAEFDQPPQPPSWGEVVAMLEEGGVPVVAALHGVVIGGGLELAMAAAYRVAPPGTTFKLPEVSLGLIPASGGTQRLPRLAGVQTALEMVALGQALSLDQALAVGLVDQCVEGDLQSGAIDFARRALRDGMRPRDSRAPAPEDAAVVEAFRVAQGRKLNSAAAKAAVRAVEAAALPFDEGLAAEQALYRDLKGSADARALLHVNRAERLAAKTPHPSAAVHPFEDVGVVGAGTMGGGIAMALLNAGLPVTLVEASQEALDKGLAVIRRNYDSTVRKGRLTDAEVQARLSRLTPVLDIAALASCDLIIEAVFESLAVKTALFERLDRIAKPAAVLASNTSFLDLSAIAAAARPGRTVIGLHFFSPAHIMRLLEVVQMDDTPPEVVNGAMALGKRLGKTPVLVRPCFGFVGNRMVAHRQRQANALVNEGALPWDVDRVMMELGFPMGPFGMSDLAGLDLGWSPETSTGSTVREILCERGRRGQKTGAGFYDYDDQRRPQPSALVEEIVAEFAARQGIAPRKIGDDEILERCLYPMINEGAKILEEGIARRASDIDVVWVNGYGWPRARGGPMWHADEIGVDVVRKALDRHAHLGEAFKPAPLLDRLARDGARFSDL